MSETPADNVVPAESPEAVETAEVDAQGVEHIRVEIRRTQGNRRLDKYLSGRLGKNTSRARLQRLIKEGAVTVNAKAVKASYTICPGDMIDMHIPTTKPKEIPAEDIPLDIRYEDEYLVVVNKSPGMVVHPARGHFTGTLVHALLAHCEKLSDIGGQTRPGVVHRLDKNTSGLIIFAKDDLAHRRLAKALSARKIEREYFGIVWGKPRESFGTIDKPIGHNPKDHKKMAVVDGGKLARTDYLVEREYRILSSAVFQLHTGRTHQIRVHLRAIGHPIFGDPEYGGREERIGGSVPEYHRFARKLLSKIDRQALHARRLTFDHPITSEKISIEAPIPSDMESIIKALEEWCS
jgi:23S rRNA pseudouridine1911/1915/1917 synthase